MDISALSEKEGLLLLAAGAAAGAAELEKQAAVSIDDARRSLDRLDTLERNAPTVRQVGRYGAVGGLGGAAIGAIGNSIEHGSALKGATPKAKALNLAANTVKGALGGGALPLMRTTLDRRAEKNTLRRFMGQDKVAATAEAEEPARAPSKALLVGGALAAPIAAASTAAEAAPRLIGSELLYHGTGPVAAKGIQQQGLDPMRGGSGAASWENANPEFVGASKGHVHLTKNRSNAELYARLGGAREAGEKMHEMDLLTSKGTGKGAVLPLSLPYDQVKKDFHIDPHGDMVNDLRSAKAVPAKAVGAVDESFLKSVWRGRPDNYLSYVKNNPKRVATGAALAAATPAFLYGGYRAGKSLLGSPTTKQAGIGSIVRALPSTAKNVALGAGERNLHLNEVTGLGVLAVPGLDTMQAGLRARLAGDRSPHAAEKRQLLGEGAHAALDVGGLGLLAAPAIAQLRAPAVAHLKHAFASSAYGGNPAQNPPGARPHSQLPAFKVQPLQVKVSSPLTRVGELVTGSKAGKLREAALRHADRAADGKLPRELKAARKLRGLAKAEEGRVGKTQGALVGAAGLGAVSDSTGLAEKVHSKEAGAFKRVGELVSGSHLNKLRAGAKDLSERALGRAAIASEAGGVAHALGRVPALIRHPKGKAMFEQASNHSHAFADSSRRHHKAALKAERLVDKEDAKVYATRAGLGLATYAGGMGALLHHKKNKSKQKEAGIGVGAGMTASQYSGPLSYGPFKMTSGIPPFRRQAMTKNDESVDPDAWMVGENKQAAAATGAMSPVGKLMSTQRVGAPKTTGFAGPSIADIAKPKGFGLPMPGAQKNQL